MMIPAKIVSNLQLWTIFTGILVQGDIIGLVFCCVVFAVSTPPSELKRGSIAFLLHVSLSAILINLAFLALALLLSVIPIRGFDKFAAVPANGAWPALVMLMTEGALADPDGSTKLLCFDVPNRMYGWIIATLFSLMSFFPMIDLFIGVALAHARAYLLDSPACLYQCWVNR